MNSPPSLRKPLFREGSVFRATIRNLVLLLLVLTVWYASVHLFDIPAFVLPGPDQVANRIASEYQYILRNLGSTLLAGLSGFLLANALSFAIVSIIHYRPSAEAAILPYLISAKAMPVVAVAPLIILWFGFGITSKMIMSALICFFPLVVNLLEGFRRVDPNLLDLFRTLGASKTETLVHLKAPASLPFLFSALKISAPMAIVGAIVAELSGTQSGIGYVIVIASNGFDTALVFAAVMAAAAMGILLYNFIRLCEQLVTKRSEQESWEAPEV
ncbi:MAG: ABC transporter permease [Alphaproteobacteria bacterium]